MSTMPPTIPTLDELDQDPEAERRAVMQWQALLTQNMQRWGNDSITRSMYQSALMPVPALLERLVSLAPVVYAPPSPLPPMDEPPAAPEE